MNSWDNLLVSVFIGVSVSAMFFVVPQIIAWRDRRRMKPPQPTEPPDDDKMREDAIKLCFKTGKMVIGNRDEHGNVTMTEHEVGTLKDGDAKEGGKK